PDISKDSNVVALFEAFRDLEPDLALFDQNFAAIKERLVNIHGFKLTNEDVTSLEYVFKAFYTSSPSLGYNAVRPGTIRILPTYEELMVDTDEHGQHRSYLATEENFAILRQFEKDNLLVPLVGDFAGSTALRSVGQYLKEHNTNVAAFYTSNVEQYLFMTDDSWRNFYKNVSTLPLNSKSVFIRPLINIGGGEYSASPQFRPGFTWDTLLFPVANLVEAFNSGMVHTYHDVVQK